MGLCYSRAGWLATSVTDTYTDCSELSTSNTSKSVIYESPRWSAETGDKGKLGTLFYKRRRRRHRCTGTPVDLFSARLEGLIHSLPGDFTIASFVGTPFVRNLEMQGMDALARSYAIAAAKASARNAFLLLQERDKSEAVEVFSPMIQIQTPSSGDDVEITIELAAPAQGGVELDSPEDGDEIEVLQEEQNSHDGEDSHNSSEFSYDIDLGAPYKQRAADQPRTSFFESCFPASGRWASVVNAAMHSACLPRHQHHESPARHNCTEASDPPEFEIQTTREISSLYRTDQTRHIVFEGGSEKFSEAGHACVGCCGSSSSRCSDTSTETCSEAGHACVGCCGATKEDASVTSRSRTVKSETGSSSDIIQLPHGEAGAATSSPSTSDVQLHKLDPILCVSTVSTPTHGLRVNTTTSKQREEAGDLCSRSSERVVELERVDSDLDAFFSFPSSPSAKVLEERGSGHIIEDMKSAKKLMEDMGLRRMLDEEVQTDSEEELEGPRSRAESPHGGGNALSKGAFGSPFPVLGASGRKTTSSRPVMDKKLKLSFSLERANTAALAKKHGASGSDGTVLTSSSESYLDTSSSSVSRPRDAGHDWDDYSSDLFEIQDTQPVSTSLKAFSSVHLSCLPLKKSFGCSHDACDGSFSEVESAPSYNSNALKYQVRGANAVRGADNRAKILREQAMKKAKSDQEVRVLPKGPVLKQTSTHQGKGNISVMVLSLLRRKQPDVKPMTKPTAIVGGPLRGKNIKPPRNSTDVTHVSVNVSSFELNGKSIKALSIRDVLERQERQEQQH